MPHPNFWHFLKVNKTEPCFTFGTSSSPFVGKWPFPVPKNDKISEKLDKVPTQKAHEYSLKPINFEDNPIILNQIKQLWSKCCKKGGQQHDLVFSCFFKQNQVPCFEWPPLPIAQVHPGDFETSWGIKGISRLIIQLAAPEVFCFLGGWCSSFSAAAAACHMRSNYGKSELLFRLWTSWNTGRQLDPKTGPFQVD